MTNDPINEIKAQVFEELDQTPDDFYFGEVLNFVLFLKQRYQLELESDLQSIQEAKVEMQREAPISLEQVKQQLGA
jgi:hypothetical protein